MRDKFINLHYQPGEGWYFAGDIGSLPGSLKGSHPSFETLLTFWTLWCMSDEGCTDYEVGTGEHTVWRFIDEDMTSKLRRSIDES
jgi:hypothetical protein